MKGCLPKIFALIGIVVVLAVVGWFAMLGMLPGIIEKQIEERTGYQATIGEMTLKPFAGFLQIENLQIENPEEDFPRSEFISLERMTVSMDVGSLRTDTIRIHEVYVHIPQIGYVINESGENNLKTFIDRLAPPSGEEAPPPEEEAEPKQFHISQLQLKIDEIVKIDHSGGRQKEKVYQVAVNVEEQDVSSPSDLLRPIGMALAKSGAPFIFDSMLSGMAGLMPDVFDEETLNSVTDGVGSMLDKAGSAIKGLFD